MTCWIRNWGFGREGIEGLGKPVRVGIRKLLDSRFIKEHIEKLCHFEPSGAVP
jgi:hypothetical protein